MVCYMAVWDANHPDHGVINPPQCSYIPYLMVCYMAVWDANHPDHGVINPPQCS